MSGPAFSESLRDRILADLNWILSSPSLLESGLDLDSGRFSLPSEFDPAPVETFLAGNCSHRVGYYFESLVQILLESDSAIGDIRHGIQIRENGDTLGEIDFLYRRGGVLHHLEVALKFYLFSPDVALHGSRLLGPNARDTFERKRDRLLRKQIPLGKEKFPDVQESHLLVKGAIFYPWREPNPPPAADGLAPGHSRGVWVGDGQLEEFFSGLPADSRGTIFKKPFWLAGRTLPESDFRSPSNLLEEISNARAKTQHPMFFGLGTMKHGRWTETERGFVVADGWPFDS